jgi:hypothetical protein
VLFNEPFFVSLALSEGVFVMRIQTKRVLQVALVSGGLLMVGTAGASADETIASDVPGSPLGPVSKSAGSLV